MYTVQISEELGKRLTDFSTTKHRDQALCIEQALKQFFLDEAGEEKAYELALARLEKGGPTVSLDDVEHRLGVSDA
jgi:predicted transcriptional regulator